MSLTFELEESARRWLRDEADRRDQAALPEHPPKLLLSPVSWVLPKLLRIVHQNSSQPVQVLAPLIRTMLLEQAFATTGGDPYDCERLEEAVDATVSVLVRVLEKARAQCESARQSA